MDRWERRGEGLRRRPYVLSFVVISVNDAQSLTHLEELQNKYDLRYAELTNLLVACAVNLPLRFPWQN